MQNGHDDTVQDTKYFTKCAGNFRKFRNYVIRLLQNSRNDCEFWVTYMCPVTVPVDHAQSTFVNHQNKLK